MRETKDFFERNKRKIKKGVIITASVTGAALLVYISFVAGFSYGAGLMGGFVHGVLEKNNCQEALDLINEAAKTLGK